MSVQCVFYGNMWRGDCCHVVCEPRRVALHGRWHRCCVLNGGSRIIAALSVYQLFGYFSLF